MKKKKIIFIDDDPDYIRPKEILLEEKYDIITAFSADEGMEKIKAHRPDLIITDAMMEPKSGFTLVKELSRHPDYKDIPVIMLTGVVPKITDSKYSSDDILRYEGDEFIEKSVKIDELIAAIERLLK